MFGDSHQNHHNHNHHNDHDHHEDVCRQMASTLVDTLMAKAIVKASQKLAFITNTNHNDDNQIIKSFNNNNQNHQNHYDKNSCDSYNNDDHDHRSSSTTTTTRPSQIMMTKNQQINQSFKNKCSDFVQFDDKKTITSNTNANAINDNNEVCLFFSILFLYEIFQMNFLLFFC